MRTHKGPWQYNPCLHCVYVRNCNYKQKCNAYKAARQLEALHCCGNCSNKKACNTDSFEFCDMWNFDGLNRKDRKGKFLQKKVIK